MTGRKDVAMLALAVIGTEFVGGASALAAGGDFRPYFEALRKPPLTPPASVFGPAWTTMYMLMGVAAWLVWRQGLDCQAAVALGLFVAQLLLNAIWSIVFFGARRPDCALLEIALLWLTILATIVAFWRVQPLAAAPLVPYLVWVSFAAYLNAGVVRLNRAPRGV
jgi:translocator protein